jgi:hypothetical protein
MTPNGKTNEGAPADEAARPSGGKALFLETSAQFHRLTGPRVIRDTINEMIDCSAKVGTSWYVEREFKYVFGKFFDTVASEVRKLSHLSTGREFWEMWQEVDYNLRKHYAGGPKFFLWLGKTLGEALAQDFGDELVSPLKLLNKVRGRREILLGNFIKRDDFFNKSRCGVWDKPHSCACGPEPDADCRLKEIAVDMRSEFLNSADALASSDCSESKWLRGNRHRLKEARGKALLELMGEHRDHVSDIVIFWEVPDGWTILTRDRAFGVMRKELPRKGIEVYNLRLPREESGNKCQVRPHAAPEAKGILTNYNAKGARVSADPVFVKKLRKREQVTISAEEFGTDEAPELGYSREGRVVYRDDEDESAFAVRFPSE